MLASAVEDTSTIDYPVLVSQKLDGIRCLIIDGKALTRKFKLIPNHHVRKLLETLPSGLDGELICPGKTFNETQSLLMTEEGEPEFEYHVVDFVKEELTKTFAIRTIVSILVKDEAHLKFIEEQYLKGGFEGTMIRAFNGPYKCGRSTLKEGYLLKLKRFTDSEAEVLGFVERMHNENEAKKDELGHTKRSSHKANKKPANTLGALKVKDVKTGVEFEIGTGFDDATREFVWNNQEKFKGKFVCYRYQSSGQKDKPRFPSFKGFRDSKDFD